MSTEFSVSKEKRWMIAIYDDTSHYAAKYVLEMHKASRRFGFKMLRSQAGITLYGLTDIDSAVTVGNMLAKFAPFIRVFLIELRDDYVPPIIDPTSRCNDALVTRLSQIKQDISSAYECILTKQLKDAITEALSCHGITAVRRHRFFPVIIRPDLWFHNLIIETKAFSTQKSFSISMISQLFIYMLTFLIHSEFDIVKGIFTNGNAARYFTLTGSVSEPLNMLKLHQVASGFATIVIPLAISDLVNSVKLSGRSEVEYGSAIAIIEYKDKPNETILICR